MVIALSVEFGSNFLAAKVKKKREWLIELQLPDWRKEVEIQVHGESTAHFLVLNSARIYPVALYLRGTKSHTEQQSFIEDAESFFNWKL